MFGKGKSRMSSTDKFVMAKGREVGNIRRTVPPMAAKPKLGKPGAGKGAKPHAAKTIGKVGTM